MGVGRLVRGTDGSEGRRGEVEVEGARRPRLILADVTHKRQSVDRV